MKARPSMEKRRKEQARRDRREEKALRREQRKVEREQRRASGDAPQTGEAHGTAEAPAADPPTTRSSE